MSTNQTVPPGIPPAADYVTNMTGALALYGALETNRRAADYAPLAEAYGTVAKAYIANGQQPPAPPVPQQAAIAFWVDANGNPADVTAAKGFSFKDDPANYCATPVPQVSLPVVQDGVMSVSPKSYQDPSTGVIYAQFGDTNPIGWVGTVPGFSWKGSTQFKRQALQMAGPFQSGMPIYVPA